MTEREYAQMLADQRNATMTRNDIEWAVDSGNRLYLRDKPSFTARNTRAIADRQEAERQSWLRNQRNQP